MRSAEAATYELPLSAGEQPASQDRPVREGACLPEHLLLQNALWFCRLRWVVIAILLVLAILGASPGVLSAIGLRAPGHWPLITACVLTICNLISLAVVRRLTGQGRPRRAAICLWAQIVADLLVLTAVVHCVGSRETLVAFAYLFHVVLAGIFFSRFESLVVAGAACVLYAGVIVAEEVGILRPGSIYLDLSGRQRPELASWPSVLDLASAMTVWLVVWYLVSRLSNIVRRRDHILATGNERLVETLKTRADHMLHTTRELKAPFAAIDANTQLLLGGYCGPLTDETLAVVLRTSARCRRLTMEIQQVLQLADLSSPGVKPPPQIMQDLPDLLRWCIQQVKPIADRRNIVWEEDLQPGQLMGVEDHLKMLFLNLLYNAVNYSHKGGCVQVRCAPNGDDSGCVVTIADEGIGIAREKLPHVFDQYYRTKEAVRHNRDSSGLGLSIVRDIAQIHRIPVRVTSRQGAGTTFQVRLRSSQSLWKEAGSKENNDGPRDDRG